MALYEGGTVTVNDTGLGASGFVLLIGVGVSGWLGGNRESAKAASTEEGVKWAETGSASTSAAGGAPTETKTEELRAVIRLTNGNRLAFRMDPSLGDIVEMSVIVCHDSPELMKCTELVARDPKGDTPFGPFTAERVGAGSELAIALSTTTKLPGMRTLSPADGPVTLEGCGETLNIEPDQTEDAHEFVKAAHAYLRAHRSAKKSAAPVEPASGEGTPGTGASAPAAPVPPRSDPQKP